MSDLANAQLPASQLERFFRELGLSIAPEKVFEVACALDHDGKDFIDAKSLKGVWLAGLRIPGGLIGTILGIKGHILRITNRLAPSLDELLLG